MNTLTCKLTSTVPACDKEQKCKLSNYLIVAFIIEDIIAEQTRARLSQAARGYSMYLLYPRAACDILRHLEAYKLHVFDAVFVVNRTRPFNDLHLQLATLNAIVPKQAVLLYSRAVCLKLCIT